MAIEIKTKKIVIRGEKKRKVISIDGLMKNELLPFEYIDGEPYVEMGYGKCIGVKFDNRYKAIRVGDIMSEKRFQECLSAIKEAGKRLHKARQREKELKKEWSGEETIII